MTTEDEEGSDRGNYFTADEDGEAFSRGEAGISGMSKKIGRSSARPGSPQIDHDSNGSAGGASSDRPDHPGLRAMTGKLQV